MTVKNWRWWVSLPLTIALLPPVAVIYVMEPVGRFLQKIGERWDWWADRKFGPIRSWIQKGGITAYNRRKEVGSEHG
jgi:hypothetical protein